MVKEDMAEVEVTEEDTEDRNNWRWKSPVATPDGKSRKKKKCKDLDFIVHVIRPPLH